MTSRWTGRQLANLPTLLLLAVVGVTAAVFIASWVVMDGGFQRAWEILLGVRSPYGEASGLGVVLSALGYLLVPAVIGIAVADGVARFTEHRLLTDPEVNAAARRIVAEQSTKPKKASA